MKSYVILTIVVLILLACALSYAWLYCIIFRVMAGLPFNTYAVQLTAMFFLQALAVSFAIILIKIIKGD